MKTYTKSLSYAVLFLVFTFAGLPAYANQSSGVDFFINADNPKANLPVVPINTATTASFTTDLGVPNGKGSEDPAPNVSSQSYTIDAGSGGIIESVVANGTIYTPPASRSSFTFSVSGGNTTATFDTSVTVHYTTCSSTDDDKVITMKGVVTFNDDTVNNPDKLSSSPSGSCTATAVEIDSLNSDATQTNVNQNVTIGTTVYNNNWAAVKAKAGVVTVTAKLKPDTDNAAMAVTWSGGSGVSGHPRQRTVSKTLSSVTGVTATCGAESSLLYVWIIWASYTIRLSGPADPLQVCEGKDFTDLVGPPFNPGTWRFDLGGGTTCGPIDHDNNAMLTYAYTIGRTQGVCSLTPSGIGKIVVGGAGKAWNMTRLRSSIAWDNGGSYFGSVYLTTPSNNQSNHNDQSPLNALDLSPASTDKLYDADDPGCSFVLSGTKINHTSEVYINFVAGATVTLDAITPICDNVTYSYEAQVDIDATARIVANVLSTTALVLPQRPHFVKR